MKRILLYIYTFFYSKNELKKYKQTNKLMWIIANVMFRLCQHLLYYNLKIRKLLGCKPNKMNPDGNIIVSLTSFPARINNVWMVVDSIMRQSVPPNRIVLYLSKEQFQKEENDIPRNLLDYETLGLEIEFREDDLKPHKKYLYAFLENPNSIVITVDDDLYYSENLMAYLLELHKKFPTSVCASTAKVLTYTQGKINPYKDWSKICKPFSPSHLNIAIGYGGVLYPTHLFKDERMFNSDLIKEYSLRADDLWLKAFELLNDIPVVTGEYLCAPPVIRGSQTISLMSSNCDTTIPQNDVQWSNINALYNLNELLKYKV